MPARVGEIEGDKFKVTIPGTVEGVTDPLPPESDGIGAPAGIDFKRV